MNKAHNFLSGKRYMFLVVVFGIFMSNCVYGSSSDISYCAAGSLDHRHGYIAKVELNTGGKSSLSSRYSDYTSSVFTTLSLGQQYTLRVTAMSNINYRECVKAWIDFNQDGDFFDPGEEINMGCYPLNGEYTFSKPFVVYPTAKTGNTRMRVTFRCFNPPVSCGTFLWGEVEDYTINIKSVDDEEKDTNETSCPSITNGGFETGTLIGWNVGKCQLSSYYSDIVCSSYSSTDKVVTTSGNKYDGLYSQQFKGSSDCSIHYSYQDITVPNNENVNLSFWLKSGYWDNGWDSATVVITDTNNKVLAIVLDTEYPPSSWTQYSYNLSNFKGQTIRILFAKREKKDCIYSSEMFVDEVKIECESLFCGGLGQPSCRGGYCSAGLISRSNICVKAPRPMLYAKMGEQTISLFCIGFYCYGVASFIPIEASITNIGGVTRSINGTKLEITMNPFNLLFLAKRNNFGLGGFDTQILDIQGHTLFALFEGEGRTVAYTVYFIKNKMDEEATVSTAPIYAMVFPDDKKPIVHITATMYDAEGNIYNWYVDHVTGDLLLSSVILEGEDFSFVRAVIGRLSPAVEVFKIVVFDPEQCKKVDAWCVIEIVSIFGGPKGKATTRAIRISIKGGPDVLKSIDNLMRKGLKPTDIELLNKYKIRPEIIDKNIGAIFKVTDDGEKLTIIGKARGKPVELQYYLPSKGKELINNLGIKRGDYKDLDQYKGALGEAIGDKIAEKRGWIRVDKKDYTNQKGIDGIYKNPKTNRYVLVESKFTSKSNANLCVSNLGKGYGYRQMSDRWIRKALDKMKEEKTISDSLHEKIFADLKKGGKGVEKELIVIKNSADEGYTITKSFGDGTDGVNLDRITIISLGDEIVK